MSLKKCSLCNKSSEADGNATIYFGKWLSKKEVTVHYYCLLLSTHLPQKGEDHGGILGFLLRDIRHEIAMAKKRNCMYCFETSASIQCFTCKKYFHITCGHTSKCLSQFDCEFKSYCHACIPVDKFQSELFARKKTLTAERCYICTQLLVHNPKSWIYAKCCGNGFTHSKCMKIYALSAGYYLTCIWCKDKSFRHDVKYQGIFVPDREANWENEKGAFRDLYRGHRRCDMEICNCPKGRDYTNANKWQLIICKFCGAYGAHNPYCVPGFEESKKKIVEFKCDVCSVTEQTVYYKNKNETVHDLIDTSLYVNKDSALEPPLLNRVLDITESSTDSASSLETVCNVKLLKCNLTPFMTNQTKTINAKESCPTASAIYTLTQSPPKVKEKINVIESCDIVNGEEASDSDDSMIANALVEEFLELFN